MGAERKRGAEMLSTGRPGAPNGGTQRPVGVMAQATMSRRPAQRRGALSGGTQWPGAVFVPVFLSRGPVLQQGAHKGQKSDPKGAPSGAPRASPRVYLATCSCNGSCMFGKAPIFE